MSATSSPPATTPREGRISLPGCEIRYVEAGDGPALLHLHGSGGLRWDPQKAMLAERFRVIAPEAPGFGGSALPTGVHSLADLADALAEMITQLADGRAHVLGTSFGGRVATWLALRHPDRVERLVLAAPASFRPADAPRLADMSAEELARRLQRRSAPTNVAQPSTPDPAAEHMRQSNLTAVDHLTAQNPPEGALLDRLSEIEAPTLVLFGVEDQLIPPENGRLYAEHMPDCHLVYVYASGHLIAQDRPDAFNRIVSEFLERGPAFVVNRG
jgi:pimeloyl-ACP methyl ester carboxylesterase